MPRPSVEERNRLLGQYLDGESPTKVLKIFIASREVGYKILQNKSKQENNFKNRHCTGQMAVQKSQVHRQMLIYRNFRTDPFDTKRSIIIETYFF